MIVKVLERKDPTADEIAAGRAATKDELLNERRGRFFAAYMTKAREKMTVRINRQVTASRRLPV